jgi:hypothetical protein
MTGASRQCCGIMSGRRAFGAASLRSCYREPLLSPGLSRTRRSKRPLMQGGGAGRKPSSTGRSRMPASTRRQLGPCACGASRLVPTSRAPTRDGSCRAIRTAGAGLPENLGYMRKSYLLRKRPGPLALGDGRYLGLGLMQPVREPSRDMVVFGLASEPRISTADRGVLLGAVRRALMSLSRRSDDTVPRLFSGHEIDGAPAGSGHHEHIFIAAADFDGDGLIDRVVVAAPWRCDRSVRPGRGDPALFDRVVSSLEVVRAGRLGVITLNADADGAVELGLAGRA